MPILEYTYIVNPEQSKPDELVPPDTYFVPRTPSIAESSLESAKALPVPMEKSNATPRATVVNCFLKQNTPSDAYEVSLRVR
jgi:hypothetical protein